MSEEKKPDVNPIPDDLKRMCETYEIIHGAIVLLYKGQFHAEYFESVVGVAKGLLPMRDDLERQIKAHPLAHLVVKEEKKNGQGSQQASS